MAARLSGKKMKQNKRIQTFLLGFFFLRLIFCSKTFRSSISALQFVIDNKGIPTESSYGKKWTIKKKSIVIIIITIITIIIIIIIIICVNFCQSCLFPIQACTRWLTASATSRTRVWARS